jgi:uncharacterized protein
MKDLIVAGGLVLVIEGLIWAAFPGLGRRLLQAAAATPDQTLRTAGAITLAAGVFVVWMVRG